MKVVSVENVLKKKCYLAGILYSVHPVVCGLEDPGSGSRQEQEIYALSRMSSSAVAPTQHPLHLVPGFLARGSATCT